MAGDPIPFSGAYPYVPYPPITLTPVPSPRVLPVNLPFSTFGVTVAVMDCNGNLTIKVDQPHEA